MRFASFGVQVALELPDDPALAERLWWVLPPDARPVGDGPATVRIAAGRDASGWSLRDAAGGEERWADVEELATALERRVRAEVALLAPGHVFVHAGVVELDGGAVIIPGYTHTGKTTLVGELLRAGCGYVSDEYAVLDAQGVVTPYPRPLSVRAADGTRRHVPASDFGGRVVTERLRARAVVSFPRDAQLGETGLRRAFSRGAVMALVGNALPARARPEEVLRAAAAVARGATYFKGGRGEAAGAAREVIESVRSVPFG